MNPPRNANSAFHRATPCVPRKGYFNITPRSEVATGVSTQRWARPLPGVGEFGLLAQVPAQRYVTCVVIAQEQPDGLSRRQPGLPPRRQNSATRTGWHCIYGWHRVTRSVAARFAPVTASIGGRVASRRPRHSNCRPFIVCCSPHGDTQKTLIRPLPEGMEPPRGIEPLTYSLLVGRTRRFRHTITSARNVVPPSDPDRIAA
ncbi:Uncharacterised protein [Mycobacteroides abscessus]|nr:Uncharacterised protein [Mycobacteroides abscessus]